MKGRDQMQRNVVIPNKPLRIISLVPSQTELLFFLGLENEVVGITKFCIHPKHWFDEKMRIGGTKNVNIEKVKSLCPTLIIGNKEENTKEDIEALEKIAPVWISDIFNLENAYEMILKIGEITNKELAANKLISEIQFLFDAIEPLSELKSCAYFIWKDPYYIAGIETFIDAMLKKIGLINWTNEKRYPEFIIGNSNPPDVILLSSEPYPFKEKHILYFQESYPNSLIQIVDGELFSWYGPRLLGAPSYFKKLQDKINEHFPLKA